ncbi:MAG: saccharopine dehydrogenase family protein, partial [Solirubrobacteraceae bacterium]
MSAERELDVVVHGATGFVGRLTAEYLATHAPQQARIGLGGRSEPRLAELRAALGPRAADWPLIVADSSDPAALAAMARRTRVVATTVGPYRRHGPALVDACAAAGTHYADLAGEVLFMRETIDRFDDAAAASGARIVHACGFDSIPSDLGVLALHRAVAADGAGELEDTTFVVTSLRGGPSGGTIASLAGQLDEMRGSGEQRRIAQDPYALSPDRAAEPELGREGDLQMVKRDAELGWLAPFVMASVNTRVVRRSNALQGWAYGRRFRYREVMSAGSGPLAPVVGGAITAGLGGLVAGLSFGPTRKLLDRVLPSPGEGPSEAARAGGHFRIEIHTRTSGGRRYRARVAA